MCFSCLGQAITARACSVCDTGGERPFATNKLLQQHVQSAHKRQLCPVCLGVRAPSSAIKS